jgi:hypothetical protein
VASPRHRSGASPRRGAGGAPAASGGAKRGAAQARRARLAGDSARGLRRVQAAPEEGQHQGAEGRAIHAPLALTRGSCAQRQAPGQACPKQWSRSDDPTRQHLGPGMASFEPGLLVGEDEANWPQDTLDLARWCRPPKGHERRMHGPRPAGVRRVQAEPPLLWALDAPREHPEPVRAED